MTYAKPTFGDMQLSLAYRYGETAIPSSGTANRNYWINRGVHYVLDKIKPLKSVSVVVSGGEYNLSATIDFKSADKLLDSQSNEYSGVAPDKYAQVEGNWYTIDNGILKAKSNDTFTMWYRYFPDTLTTTADVCPFTDSEAPVAYAYAMLRKSETDPLEDADKNMTECEERIKLMQINENENNDPLIMKNIY